MINKSFKKTADIGVARYMGEIKGPPVVKFFIDFFPKKEGPDVEQGFVVRGFDWDGSQIWTPCDCKLAANVWDARDGKFVKHIQGDTDESWATIYVHKISGDEVIFGNGCILFHSKYFAPGNRILDSDFDSTTMQVARDGDTIALLKDSKSNAITIWERSGSGSDFNEYSIYLDKNQLPQEYCDWKFTFWGDGFMKRPPYIYMYSRTKSHRLEPGKPNAILLAALDRKRIISGSHLNAIESISNHPNQSLLAVLGEELTILSVPELNKVKSAKLPIARESEWSYYCPIAYSSCGRYLALSYAVNGEVEVRDAETLNVLNVFNGQGIPQPDMSWDVTGRYLACRFESRERGMPTLVVWDVKSQQQLLQTESSGRETPIAFRWSPDSTALACLVDNQRVQVFELT